MRFVVAPGGIGGLGNATLANPKRKAPGFALLGTPGWEGDVVLELKTVADVALVGFPSAGKSSLIAAISAARPKIADYPFTTLHPNLGVVQAGDVRFTVADVPGLIEGASEGKGLGLEFLRHVERCTALVHVLDCATLEPGRDPLSDLDVILAELAAYPVPEGQVPLLERPQLIALNKVDVPEAQDLAELVRPDLEARGFRVFEISTVSHAGLRQLTFALADLVAQHRIELAAAPAPERIVIRPRGSAEGVHRARRGRHVRHVLPDPRREAGALGAADRLPERGGRGLPRRPAREARRRGRALPRRCDSRRHRRHRRGRRHHLRLGARPQLRRRAHDRAARHRSATASRTPAAPRRSGASSTTR